MIRRSASAPNRRQFFSLKCELTNEANLTKSLAVQLSCTTTVSDLSESLFIKPRFRRVSHNFFLSLTCRFSSSTYGLNKLKQPIFIWYFLGVLHRFRLIHFAFYKSFCIHFEKFLDVRFSRNVLPQLPLAVTQIVGMLIQY